jgi:hypothetical protein
MDTGEVVIGRVMSDIATGRAHWGERRADPHVAMKSV